MRDPTTAAPTSTAGPNRRPALQRGDAERRGRSRQWLTFHRWFGLPVWAFLFFVCVSGTIASVSREIAWLVDPRVRATNPDGQPHAGYDAMAEAVRRTYPDADILWLNEDEPYLSAFVGVALPDAAWGTVYVNPYTAEVQGLTRGYTFPGFMRELHAWLLLPWTRGTSIGYYLVGAMGLVLIGLIVTGLKVHKRFWRTFRQPRLRTDRGARVWWGDLHRIVGAWAVWFAATIAVTGVWFLTQGILWDAEIPFQHLPAELAREEMPRTVVDGDAETAQPRRSADVAGAVRAVAPRTGGGSLEEGPEAEGTHFAERVTPPPRVGFDSVAAAARTVAPALDITWLVPPATPYGTIEVLGEDGPALLGDYATAVYVNPWTGDVVDAHPAGELGPLGVLDHAADPLHYGNFAGLWSRLIWFVFGSGLSALVFSGMMIWTKRTARATPATSPDRLGSIMYAAPALRRALATASRSGPAAGSSAQPAPHAHDHGSRARGVSRRAPIASPVSRTREPSPSNRDARDPFAEPAGLQTRGKGAAEETP